MAGGLWRQGGVEGVFELPVAAIEAHDVIRRHERTARPSVAARTHAHACTLELCVAHARTHTGEWRTWWREARDEDRQSEGRRAGRCAAAARHEPSPGLGAPLRVQILMKRDHNLLKLTNYNLNLADNKFNYENGPNKKWRTRGVVPIFLCFGREALHCESLAPVRILVRQPVWLIKNSIFK
jgi:hypothetical protein